jgi:hypothetical protein
VVIRKSALNPEFKVWPAFFFLVSLNLLHSWNVLCFCSTFSDSRIFIDMILKLFLNCIWNLFRGSRCTRRWDVYSDSKTTKPVNRLKVKITAREGRFWVYRFGVHINCFRIYHWFNCLKVRWCLCGEKKFLPTIRITQGLAILEVELFICRAQSAPKRSSLPKIPLLLLFLLLLMLTLGSGHWV